MLKVTNIFYNLLHLQGKPPGIEQDDKKLENVTHLEQRTLGELSIPPRDMIPLYCAVVKKILQPGTRFISLGRFFT